MTPPPLPSLLPVQTLLAASAWRAHREEISNNELDSLPVMR